ncbi:MAG: phage major capsid protein, partial [Ilumatobacteraceae bacterium]
MASNLKRLEDRAAAISASLKDLSAVAERSEEQNTEVRRLMDEADKVKADLEFEGKLVAKESEIRSVVEKAAPAKPAAAEPKRTEIRHVLPHHTSLRCFNDSPEAVEAAYRTGRWLRATVYKNADDIRWCRDHGVENRALTENTNSAGGALVPEEFAQRVIRLVETYGTFPGAAESVSMSRDTMVIPKRVTGTTAYFVGEGSSITESEPTYTNVSLVAKKLAVGCRMSTEVVEDTSGVVGMAAAVGQEFGTRLAYKIALCGWLGAGTRDYGGIPRGV